MSLRQHRAVTQAAGTSLAALDTNIVAASPPTIPTGLLTFKSKRYDGNTAGGLWCTFNLMSAAGGRVGRGTLALTVLLVRVVYDPITDLAHPVGTTELTGITPGTAFVFDSIPPGEYIVLVTAQAGAAAANFTQWVVLVEEV